jgi:hypothetical protein
VQFPSTLQLSKQVETAIVRFFTDRNTGILA